MPYSASNHEIILQTEQGHRCAPYFVFRNYLTSSLNVTIYHEFRDCKVSCLLLETDHV